MSYRGTYEPRAIVSTDGSRTNLVTPLPGVQISQWSWPVGNAGGEQLARAILYDFLHWTPSDPVPQNFKERFLDPLEDERDWEISDAEIATWWQAQKAKGIVVFDCSNEPLGEPTELHGLIEECHRHGLVTFVPFVGAQDFDPALLQLSLTAARRAAQWEVSFAPDTSAHRSIGSIVAGTPAGLERLRRIMPHEKYVAIDVKAEDAGEQLIALLLGP